MTDSDLFPFLDVFRSLTRVFPLRGEAHELQDVGKSYFKALRRFSLAQVKDGAEACVAFCKHFPKPAEWADRVPKRIAVEIPELSTVAAAVYLEAERKFYEDEPCTCEACRAAGVTHRFLRFVPDVGADDRDVKARIGERIVTCGHWAHGEELRRWYLARDRFRDQFAGALSTHQIEQTKKRPFHERLEAIYAKRETV